LGSPLSLILFFLYVEPIVRKRGTKRLGYIDDVKSIYVASNIQTV